LNVGDSQLLTIPVTVTDEHGATDTTQIRISVHGTNDAPVAGAEVTATLDEGAAALEGQLGATDIDDAASLIYTLGAGAEPPAGFSLNPDGSYRFDPSDPAYDHLNVGDSQLLTIPVTVTDEHGATDTTQIRISVHGTNDAPVAGAEVSASVDEGTALIEGRLAATDVDDAARVTYAVADGAEIPAGFSLNPDGTYSFDPSDAAYDHLDPGETETLLIPVRVTDEHGVSDTTQIKITINGALVTAEGGNAEQGQMTARILEDGSTGSFSVAEGAEIPAGFTLNADGSYRFDPADPAYDHLNVGDTQTLVVPVTVTSDSGAVETAELKIVVKGTNDIPTLGEVAEFFVVGHESQLPPGASAADIHAANGMVSVTEDGTIVYTPNEGFIGSDTLVMEMTMGDQVMQVPIMEYRVGGAPEIALSATEGGELLTGVLAGADLDDNAELNYRLPDGVEPPAGFVLHEDGTYSFDPADASYAYLKEGQRHEIRVPVTVSDEHGASAEAEIVIELEGTNSLPVATAGVHEAFEGQDLIQGQLVVADHDSEVPPTVSVTSGAAIPAGFMLNADGIYSFDPGDPAYEHLNPGDSQILNIPVTVTDDQGATTTTTIQITINGAGGATVNEGDPLYAGQLPGDFLGAGVA
ncbi:MAG: hypothetical protein B0D87_01370, partial [Candidatus Sedimenticola endophacoides]